MLLWLRPRWLVTGSRLGDVRQSVLKSFPISARRYARTQRAMSTQGIRGRELWVRDCIKDCIISRGRYRRSSSGSRPVSLRSHGLLLVWLQVRGSVGLGHIHALLRARRLTSCPCGAHSMCRRRLCAGDIATSRCITNGNCRVCYSLLCLAVVWRRWADQVDGGRRGGGPGLGSGSQTQPHLS